MAVDLGRIALTKQQVRSIRIALTHAADLMDRLLVDNHVPYTKMVAPAQPQQYPAPQGYAGQMQPVPTPQASQIAPPGGY